jgi:cell division protein FtsQ
MSWRSRLIVLCSVAALAMTAVGVYEASRSSLFLVRVVEVSDSVEEGATSPVDADTIAKLADVKVGQVSLFDMNLGEIERRLLGNPWIREVRLQKRFPETLSIGVTFREPVALLESEAGALSYVDVDGRGFGQASLGYRADLPILSGFDAEPAERIRAGLHMLADWAAAPVGRATLVSSLHWDTERGFRLLVSYPVSRGSGAVPRENGARSRAWIDLGQDSDATSEAQLQRLSQVFFYLSRNGIPARQIFADAGKKIVVRTAHGS